MSNWQKVPNVGDYVKSSHPITVLNPDEFFMVMERRFDREKIFVRGEKTAWFNVNMLSPKPENAEQG